MHPETMLNASVSAPRGHARPPHSALIAPKRMLAPPHFASKDILDTFGECEPAAVRSVNAMGSVTTRGSELVGRRATPLPPSSSGLTPKAYLHDAALLEPTLLSISCNREISEWLRSISRRLPSWLRIQARYAATIESLPRDDAAGSKAKSRGCFLSGAFIPEPGLKTPWVRRLQGKRREAYPSAEKLHQDPHQLLPS